MIPISNGKGKGCDPISSNCVIWQGPDIPCIDLCHGDTISDVIAKLAEELCNIIDTACECDPNLDGLNLDCIISDVPLDFTLVETLQWIIDYICDPSNWPDGLPEFIQLNCLSYVNSDESPTEITELPFLQWTELIAARICTNIDAINQINNDISNIYTILEGIGPPDPVVFPTVYVNVRCLEEYNVSEGEKVALDVWAVAIQQSLCKLWKYVGNDAEITAAIAATCVFGADDRLSVPGDIMTNAPGWINSQEVNTISESFTNLWISLCDARLAIQQIQDNCCVVGCDGASFAFTATTENLGPGGTASGINIQLDCVIPPGFVTCGNGLEVIVSDGNVSQSQTFPGWTNTPQALLLFNDMGALSISANYTVSMNFCIVDNLTSSQCTSSLSQDISNGLNCPTITVTASASELTYQFTPNAPANSVTYNVILTDSIGGVITQNSYTPTNFLSIVGAFSGLTPSTTYGVQMSITQQNGSGQTICAVAYFITAAALCDNILVPSSSFVEAPLLGSLELGYSSPDSGTTFQQITVSEDPVTNLPTVNLLTVPNPGCTPNCPTGTQLTIMNGSAVTQIDCNGSSYPIVVSESEWWYVDQWISTSGIIYYVYALWDIQADPADPTTDVKCNEVLFCCECPVWILDETLAIDSAGMAVFTPSTVSYGTPITYSFTQGNNGSVVEAPTGTFTYTPTPGTAVLSDWFTVEMSTPCGSAEAIMLIEFSSAGAGAPGGGYGPGGYTENTAEFVFINTSTVSLEDGEYIASRMQQRHSQLALDCPEYTGDMYIACVHETDYLTYTKAAADNGASVTLNADPSWDALNVLPAEWDFPGTLSNILNIQIFGFVNNAAGEYHDSNLVSGYGGVPTQTSSAYLGGYDDFKAARDGGINPTVWSSALGIAEPLWTRFGMLLFPKTTGTVGADSAFLLQAYAALSGTLINVDNFVATGDTDIRPWLQDGLAPLNPYDGALTIAGNTTIGLVNFGILGSFNQVGPSYSFDTTDFTDRVSELCTPGCPSGEPISDNYAIRVCVVGDLLGISEDPAFAPYAGTTQSIKIDLSAECLYVETTSLPDTLGDVNITETFLDCETCEDPPIAGNWIIESCTGGIELIIEEDPGFPLVPGMTIYDDVHCYTVQVPTPDPGVVIDYQIDPMDCTECELDHFNYLAMTPCGETEPVIEIGNQPLDFSIGALVSYDEGPSSEGDPIWGCWELIAGSDTVDIVEVFLLDGFCEIDCEPLLRAILTRCGGGPKVVSPLGNPDELGMGQSTIPNGGVVCYEVTGFCTETNLSCDGLPEYTSIGDVYTDCVECATPPVTYQLENCVTGTFLYTEQVEFADYVGGTVNIGGKCQKVTIALLPGVTAEFEICEGYPTDEFCTECSNYVLTDCVEEEDDIIVCADLSAYVGSAITINSLGIDENKCWTVAPTLDSPPTITEFEVNQVFPGPGPCFDCVMSNAAPMTGDILLEGNESEGTILNVASDPATDGEEIGRWDSSLAFGVANAVPVMPGVDTPLFSEGIPAGSDPDGINDALITDGPLDASCGTAWGATIVFTPNDEQISAGPFDTLVNNSANWDWLNGWGIEMSSASFKVWFNDSGGTDVIDLDPITWEAGKTIALTFMLDMDAGTVYFSALDSNEFSYEGSIPMISYDSACDPTVVGASTGAAGTVDPSFTSDTKISMFQVFQINPDDTSETLARKITLVALDKAMNA